MPGIDPPHLAGLKAKAEAAGVPVTVKPAAELNAPDHAPEVLGASVQSLDDIMRDPEGEPVRHTKIDAEQRHEEVTPAAGLDPSYAWFFMGFAYTLIPGLDRSLFEVYQAAGNTTVPVRTHRAAVAHIADVVRPDPDSRDPDPTRRVKPVSFHANPWAWLIQGIPLDHVDTFKAFVASYRFKALPGGTASAELTRPGEQLWLIDWIQFRIADPMTPAGLPSRGVDVHFALPVNETTKRGLQLQNAPGLLLRRPGFMVKDFGSHGG